MKTQIPIYRAKRIYGDEYVDGYLISSMMIEASDWTGTEWIRYIREIDPSTLAIHFPDMLDSEGTKIFASLSEDGKGGDVCEFPHHKETIYYQNNRFFAGVGLELFTVKNISKSFKVTGIQE